MPDLHPALQTLHDGLLREAGGDSRRLFVLLDACQIRGLRTFLQECGLPHVSLYRGEAEIDLAHTAPYLAELDPAGDLPAWFFIELEAASTALMLVADGDLESVRKHWRRFLIVEDAGGREVFFRFYDVRTVEPFLSACTLREKQQFFGPVRKLLAFPNVPPAREPLFQVWCAPPPNGTESAPTAQDKFRLRPEHEQAFAADVLSRYEARVIVYLRKHHSAKLESQNDERIRGKIGRAREIAGKLEIDTGRNVTILTEALVLGMNADDGLALVKLPVRERPAALETLRDRLAATGDKT